MTNTALYWLAIHIAHGHAVDLSVLAAAQFLPMLLLSRRAGMIASRYQPARILIYATLGQMVGAAAVGLPLISGWMTIWYLWLLSLGIGCAQTVGQPAGQIFMLDLVGAEELRRGASLSSFFTGMAKIVGPGLAGFMIATIGTGPVFLADAVSFIGVIITLIWLSRTVSVDHGRVPSGLASARRFRWVLDLPRSIQLAAAMALLIGGFGYQFEITNPLVATKVFHLTPEAFGVLGTLMAVGGLVGSFYSSRKQNPRASEFILWALVFGIAECLAAVMPSPWAYEAVMIVIGATITLFAVTATVFIRQTAQPSQLGQALSAYNAAFIGFVPAGAFAIAAIATIAGTRWALILPGFAVLGFSGVVAMRNTLRSRRRVEEHVA